MSEEQVICRLAKKIALQIKHLRPLNGREHGQLISPIVPISAKKKKLSDN
jgi:hypothetical protein